MPRCRMKITAPPDWKPWTGYNERMEYPILRVEVTRRGLNVADLARAAGKNNRAIYNRLSGSCDWTLDEALAIRDKLFPDLAVEYLFRHTIVPPLRTWNPNIQQ